MKVFATLGDYYHKEENYKEALLSAVDSIEGLDIIYVNRENLIDRLSEKPDIVILASENRLNPNDDNVHTWLTESDDEKIIDYVKSGGNWFAWHSGLAGYEENDAFVSMLGGYFTQHPDEHVNVRYLYKDDHELSQGKDLFTIKDEHYFIERLEESSYFLESSSEHGTFDAGWTRKYGEGKVCCYIPSHNAEGLMAMSVQRDLKDIINWFRK